MATWYAVMKMYYKTYLLSDHWKALRLSKLKAARFACEKCKARSDLQVHHLRYRNLFDVTLDDLKCLCVDVTKAHTD